MKIELENGSTIEAIESTSCVRGERASYPKINCIVNKYTFNRLSSTDVIRDYLNDNINNLNKFELVEICYTIDKYWDSCLIDNNDEIDVTGYKTKKYAYEEYINDFLHDEFLRGGIDDK